MKQQKTPNSQSNPEKKSKARSTPIPDFKIYKEVIAIKTAGTGTKTDTQINATELKAQK